MPSGACLCGGLKMTFEGEPANKALCHCLDCRKISGSVYSTNIVIKEDTFKWTAGKPKEFSKTADSGNEITSFFCPDCGTTLTRKTASFPGMLVVKAGVLDDVESAKPVNELFVKHRVSWVPQINGTNEVQAMS